MVQLSVLVIIHLQKCGMRQFGDIGASSAD